MRHLLILPFLLGVSLPAQAEIDPKVRKACLPAVDFEGCVRSYTQPKAKFEQLDFLGRPIIKGWKMVEDRPNNQVFYANDKDVRKVKVRGDFGRYITYEYVQRVYDEGASATSGFSSTIGSGTTNCYGYGSSMTCTSTPPPKINIPGRAGRSAGVKQRRVRIIVDCLARTAKWIPFDKSKGRATKWESFEGLPSTQPIADINCSKINSLPESDYLKLKKGRTNQDDLLAQEVLPGSTPEQIRNLEWNIRKAKERKNNENRIMSPMDMD